MDSVIDDLIIYKLNNFLDIKNKTKLRLVNKHFYQLETKAISFHLGTLIANYLGLNPKCNYELKILRKNKFEFLKIISEYLLKEKEAKEIKTIQNYNIPLGIILRINNVSLDVCKTILKQKYIFRHSSLYLKKHSFYKVSKYDTLLKKKFFNVYALI